MHFTPDSYGARLQEFNPCHSKQDGKFCSEGKTITVNGREVTVVRPKRAGALVMVDVAAFDAAFQREGGFYVGKAGAGGIGTRYADFEAFIKTADSMEASKVSVQPNGRVGFTNGRHRYAYLRDAGLTQVPVSMDKASLPYARKFGLLKVS